MQGVYQVEEGGGFLFFHGEEHNVIDSQQTGMYNPVVGHHCGGGQFLHFQACHYVLHRHHVSLVTGLYGLIDQSCRNEGLPCTGRSHKYDIVGLLHPVQLA